MIIVVRKIYVRIFREGWIEEEKRCLKVTYGEIKKESDTDGVTERVQKRESSGEKCRQREIKKMRQTEWEKQKTAFRRPRNAGEREFCLLICLLIAIKSSVTSCKYISYIMTSLSTGKLYIEQRKSHVYWSVGLCLLICDWFRMWLISFLLSVIGKINLSARTGVNECLMSFM